MNREDIIRMAREAGMVPHRPFTLAHLRDFAALVAAAEREACAQVCESLWNAAECADAIRARGKQ
jgi:hypothetical protein